MHKYFKFWKLGCKNASLNFWLVGHSLVKKLQAILKIYAIYRLNFHELQWKALPFSGQIAPPPPPQKKNNNNINNNNKNNIPTLLLDLVPPKFLNFWTFFVLGFTPRFYLMHRKLLAKIDSLQINVSWFCLIIWPSSK